MNHWHWLKAVEILVLNFAAAGLNFYFYRKRKNFVNLVCCWVSATFGIFYGIWNLVR